MPDAGCKRKTYKKVLTHTIAFDYVRAQMSATISKVNSIRLPEDLQEKVERIAEKNHLAVSDVIRLCLAQALPAIEKNGLTIKPA
jgi:hypothetical protein